jgi:CheY-like chemotaxis protein
MLPYGLRIETASNGIEAVDKIKSGNKYDIIFMDHMMPEMNGVEAAKIIRGMGYAGTIVALTANAVAGSAEMFLANGFDGYLSKPIDIRELNVLLNHMVRDKHPREVVEAARREKQSPVSAPEPEIHINEELAAAAVRDIENAITVLKGISSPGGTSIKSFTTTVHGMRSALANIGEARLSDAAHKLEEAGVGGRWTAITAGTPGFIKELQSLVEKLKRTETSAGVSPDGTVFLKDRLEAIKTACNAFDINAAKAALDDLKLRTWPGTTAGLLDEISVALLRGEVKNVASAVERAVL